MVAGGAGVTLLPHLAVPLENRRDALRIRAFVDFLRHAYAQPGYWRKLLAKELGLGPDDYEPYGRGKAKLDLALLTRAAPVRAHPCAL